MGASTATHIRQSAALPFTLSADGLRYLIITSTSRKRWLIPKGHLEPEMTAAESAANEAFEEAGVLGTVETASLGRYAYRKWGRTFEVDVFALRVRETLTRWPEDDRRHRRWVSPARAGELVRPAGLATIVLHAEPRLAGKIDFMSTSPSRSRPPHASNTPTPQSPDASQHANHSDRPHATPTRSSAGPHAPPPDAGQTPNAAENASTSSRPGADDAGADDAHAAAGPAEPAAVPDHDTPAAADRRPASTTPHRPRDVVGRQLDQLIREAGGDPEQLDGQLVRQMMHTALKLVEDGADTGELKLIGRSFKELRYALKVFRPYAHWRKISIFGSARTGEDHADYQAAEAFSRAMAESGWMVITGAGDGIMRAGHGGAGRDASFGVSIRLPFETTANEIIAGDPKLVNFRYFFTRKLMFTSQAHAVALFPGGFGTHDEGFEVLTLVQTGKTPMVPIVMIDHPGGRYWNQWDAYVRGHLLEEGMISPDDLNLYLVTDDIAQAHDHVQRFYRNYHSQRFVHEHLVLRMNHALSHEAVGRLNDEFADLVAEGRIEQRGPFDAEDDHLDLPRLSFIFTRHGYGRLRLLIDRINELAP